MLFEQLARVGKALANPKRLQLIDVLAQGERTVEALAQATALKLTTASAHLQALRASGLVRTRREGARIYYRLADDDVARLCVMLRDVAVKSLAGTARAAREFLGADEAAAKRAKDELSATPFSDGLSLLGFCMNPAAGEAIRLTSLSRGAGCACKLPLAKLEDLFASIQPGLAAASGDLLIGAQEGDDAAVLRLDAERALVLTTDFFTPIVDDAYDWGRVAAANALSDVYAMGGRPLIAVNLTAWPADDLPMELLAEVLRGGTEVAAAAGCPVAGGHTIDDPIPKYGMAVVGMAHPDKLFAIDRARAGDQLILTKPIGTGVIATALKNGAAPAGYVQAAVASMTRLNAAASEAALAAGVRAATDVTGFGLLGHLHRMLRASGVAAEIHAGRVPLLPGARELAAAGFVPGGTRANLAHLAGVVDVAAGVAEDVAVLLHDAQTSGGLLIAAPPGDTSLPGDLLERGLTAAVIGRVGDGPAGHIQVLRDTP